MSSALTQANRDQAITQAHEIYSRVLVACVKRPQQRYDDPLHVAKLQVIVKAIVDVGRRLGLELEDGAASPALTPENVDQALREVHTRHVGCLAFSRKDDHLNRVGRLDLHVAHLQIIVGGVEDLAAKMGVDL